ncbi:MAG: universal stress protein [Armatimonadota bacterium]|nr:universal stress protein [Armatimonadota bacterium]
MKAIMVGVDGSPKSEVAVRYAVELAGIAGADVVGVACAVEDFDGEVEFDEHTVEEIEGLEHIPTAAVAWFRGALDTCGETCSTADLDFTPRLLAGRPGEVLVEEAQACDMVVIGAKGRRDQHAELLGGTAHHVIRRCIKPVLITRGEYREITRVMVGYDGSPASGHAVEWVADLAALGGWEVGIVTGAMPESALAEGVEYAARLVGTRGIDADVARVEGDAPSVIFDQASEWEPDLIAVGGAVRGTLTGFFLGEAWPDIVEQAEVPVLRWR